MGAWIAGAAVLAIVAQSAAQPPMGGGMMPGMAGPPGAAAVQAPEATPLPEAISAWRVEHFKQGAARAIQSSSRR